MNMNALALYVCCFDRDLVLLTWLFFVVARFFVSVSYTHIDLLLFFRTHSFKPQSLIRGERLFYSLYSTRLYGNSLCACVYVEQFMLGFCALHTYSFYWLRTTSFYAISSPISSSTAYNKFSFVQVHDVQFRLRVK